MAEQGLANEIPIAELMLSDKEKLTALLNSLNVSLFEYFSAEDVFITYKNDLSFHWKSEGYLANLACDSHIWLEDQPKMHTLLREAHEKPAEVRVINGEGKTKYFSLSVIASPKEKGSTAPLVGTIQDITQEKEQEQLLREKACRDPLTMLYNRDYGQKMVNEYLYSKGPFVSCAMLVIDIDFFKQVNDTYGHLFGDKVLLEVARLLRESFEADDVFIRAGGDEFAVFVRSTSYTPLVQRVSSLLERVRALSFEKNSCKVTCSVGVCILPENTFGYTYRQLFGNADWALYRAKRFGRDRYEFCDNLQRFESAPRQIARPDEEIDERYLHNDVISTAFEIFEKQPTFDSAIHLLLKVVGLRLQLDRITVISTSTHDRVTTRSYQWRAPGVPEALAEGSDFSKEDFLTLFRSYDTYGTAVLDYDNLSMYSEGAQRLLMQGSAKTAVYAAMYCEGHYSGAVSYVNCDSKRHWSQAQRCQLGELTKIISAHITKSQVLNHEQNAALSAPDLDPLTGLVSFTRFREETERIIVGDPGGEYVIVYSDFENFKYLNRKCGYQQGDYLLKKFASYISGMLSDEPDIYFSRVVADQFVLFWPCRHVPGLDKAVDKINRAFVQEYARQFPEVELRIRSGIYCIEPDCSSASAAIDAANYARRQVKGGSMLSACVYTKQLEEVQLMENDILSGLADALEKHEFKVYLQPKFSLLDRSVVGAEALVRWQKPNGDILPPGDFVPLYERSGRILDLDFYMFERVAEFLAKNNRLGRRQLPISINASILHTSNPDTVQRYVSILKQHGVDPALTEIELTETATVAEYDGVVRLFRQLRDVGILTSLDDFGAGYSVLNAVIDIPVNTVKIDRMFLNCCETNEKGVYFLKHIIAMVKGLGYHVLCEGVETEHQVELLREAGCETAQGYLFSKPIPIEEYEKLVYGDGQ